jgi:hypothetical protein
MVAGIFCQSGADFSVIRPFFPDMTPQKYRSHLDKISTQALN